jgi:hypothetical protein
VEVKSLIAFGVEMDGSMQEMIWTALFEKMTVLKVVEQGDDFGEVVLPL